MKTNKHNDFLRSMIEEVVKEFVAKKPMFKEEGNEPEVEEKEEVEIETPKDREMSSFEENPVNFILQKYPSLNATLQMLMSKNFKDYITGIYILAPKPTTFKIVLHNGQEFTLAFMGKAYEAKVEGKRYFLLTIGEKERATIAIARLLETGSPIKTEGPESEETSKPDSGEGKPEPATEEEPASTGEEETTES
jgi:hypothetical protein